jgi:kynurenine formamidase
MGVRNAILCGCRIDPANRVRNLLACTLLVVTGIANAEQCQSSKWGADDEIGAANYVSPEQTLMAVKLVRKGESHPLGIVVDPGMPAFPPRNMSLQVVQPGQHNDRQLAQDFGWDMVYNDDMAQLWFGIGPQLDGLGHMGEADEYYNCNKAADFIDIAGLKKLGTDKVPPLVGRGVLLDMALHFGVESLQGGQGISSADIKQAARAQGVEIRQGDIVLFHTGWTDAKLATEPATWGSMQPGLTNEAAAYVASLNPMAVGADTWGLEAVPAVTGDKLFYGHVEFLKKKGIYILETMNTGRLASEQVSEFMFVLGQARIKGTVQMIINPVALW